MSIGDRITYELVDRVARIELVRTDAANSLDERMGEALRAVAEHAARDAESGSARVVLLAAKGRIFSVGGDLSEFAAAADRSAQLTATAGHLHAGLATIQALTVPVISVINGTAAGGGLGLALSGDIVIAAAEAKLVMAYPAVGLSPDCGLSWLIPHRLSWARAMDLALANRTITGAEAAEWGLVSRAVPEANLEEAVEQIVTGLRNGPSDALASAKRLMLESRGRTLVDQMEHEAATISWLAAEPDGVEGVDAFLAKRRPSFG